MSGGSLWRQGLGSWNSTVHLPYGWAHRTCCLPWIEWMWIWVAGEDVHQNPTPKSSTSPEFEETPLRRSSDAFLSFFSGWCFVWWFTIGIMWRMEDDEVHSFLHVYWWLFWFELEHPNITRQLTFCDPMKFKNNNTANSWSSRLAISLIGNSQDCKLPAFTINDRWWFQTLFIFTPTCTWGGDPIWLIWIETTN